MVSILVGLDASQRAPCVLKTAIGLARTMEAKLTLLRAISLPIEIPSEVYAVPPTSLTEMLMAEARKNLDEMSKSVPTELLGGIRVELGPPWQAIVETAKRLNVNLIVIGSHGYRALERLMGTCASGVVNHADRSVFVVRQPELLELW